MNAVHRHALKRREKAAQLLHRAISRHGSTFHAAVDVIARRLKQEEQLRFTIALYENICQSLKAQLIDAQKGDGR